MESGDILDSAVTASSVYDSRLLSYFARLNLERVFCSWTPKNADRPNPWIQVDLGVITAVTGVATQGRGCRWPQWVTSYTVSYSEYGQYWKFFQESRSGSVKVCL